MLIETDWAEEPLAKPVLDESTPAVRVDDGHEGVSERLSMIDAALDEDAIPLPILRKDQTEPAVASEVLEAKLRELQEQLNQTTLFWQGKLIVWMEEQESALSALRREHASALSASCESRLEIMERRVTLQLKQSR